MRMTCLSSTLLSVAAIVLCEMPSAALGAAPPFPVSIENCDISTTYTKAPERVFTMNQAATEIMLALGLQDRMVGTAFLDDTILPEFAAAYEAIPVRTTGYPSRDTLLTVNPDFVYAAYPSAFSEEVAGMRELLESGTNSYLSPSRCNDANGSTRASMEAVFSEIRDIGRIFGVLPRAEQLIAGYQADLTAIRQQIGQVDSPLRVFWYDSSTPPFVGACCGTPNEILRLAGAQNIFGDMGGAWATVSWADLAKRNPEVIVLVDASWSPASQKRQWLQTNRASAAIDAVRYQRFVTIPFSDSTPGIRNIAAVRRIAEALYPDKFQVASVQ